MELKVQLNYRWQDLLNKNNKPYYFLDRRSTVQRKPLEISGIYRWIDINKRKKQCLYVGQTSNIYNRLYGYLSQHKTQVTNYRVGKNLREVIPKGHKIKFQLLVISQLCFKTKRISQRKMYSLHLRQLIEQSLIYQEKMIGGCSLNR